MERHTHALRIQVRIAERALVDAILRRLFAFDFKKAKQSTHTITRTHGHMPYVCAHTVIHICTRPAFVWSAFALIYCECVRKVSSKTECQNTRVSIIQLCQRVRSICNQRIRMSVH